MTTESMASYAFGNLQGHVFLFWFLAVIAVLIGLLIYGGCAYPHFRRAAFRTFKGSRILGLLLGGGVALFLVILFYLSTWMEFYRMNVGGDRVELCYYCPERTETIPFDQIQELKKGMTLDKFDDRQLIIYTKDGKRFKSANVSADVMYALMRILDGRIR